MKGDAPISGIYQMGEAPRMTPAEKQRQLFELRQTAWKRQGIFVVDPTDVSDDWLRQAIRNEGNRLYGWRQA